MKKAEFRAWLENFELHDATIDTYVRNLDRLEREEDFDLDEQFQKDEMAEILQRFTYSTEDERNNRPNPTKLNLRTNFLLNLLLAYKSQLKKYQTFCLSTVDSSINTEQQDTKQKDVKPKGKKRKAGIVGDKEKTFKLEKYLQAVLRENIKQLDEHLKDKLKIIDGDAEYKVPSGKIDILARDTKGYFVIIELKAGTAKGDVIGQTLGYMADIVKEMKTTKVRGIIMAGDFHKRVHNAASLSQKIDLISYNYIFSFKNKTPKPIKLT